MSASGEFSTTMHRLLHASGPHPIPPPNDPKRCVLVGSSSNADVGFNRWCFSCVGQSRALRDSEATTFCEQEPAVALGDSAVGVLAHIQLLRSDHLLVAYQISRDPVCGNCCTEYRGCEDERQYRTLISLLGLLALMRRVVNYHSSWVGKQQVELFDASGIRVWCKYERVISVFLYTHQWPPFIAGSIELCLRSLATFLRLKPSPVVLCLMHSICILSYAIYLAVSVALRTGGSQVNQLVLELARLEVPQEVVRVSQ
ncbi:myosin-17-like [Dorcoceras hygrometricum]|uniref:Myosin-17-like n=1 Tax=Dorcoceras hygrometricum TaxID=472368 RepID=A0A2Z7BG92_9LAMI|nr:myosin-17-like [Dorcoceras hygrometricum]